MHSMKIYFPTLSSFTNVQLNELCDLINRVYFVTDSVLIDPKIPRTTIDALITMIAKKELMVAELDDHLIGCVNVKKLNKKAAFFSLLVAHPEYRKQGIGKQLVHAVEVWAKEQGCNKICLELLRPKNWVHEHKEFLKIWYTRLGYVEQKKVPKTIDVHLSPSRLYFSQFLITPCDFNFFCKNFAPQ